MTLRVGTFDFCMPEWENIFYPAGVTDYGGMLQHYGSKFCTTEISLESITDRTMCKYLLKGVKGNSAFRYIFTYAAPNGMVDAEEFSSKYSKPLSRFQKAGYLGGILIIFPAVLTYSVRLMNALRKMMNDLPTDISFMVEVFDSSWLLPSRVRALFEKHDNWSMVVSCLQNHFSHAGWAGSMPSTFLKSKAPSHLQQQLEAFPKKPIHYIRFYGSHGKECGSYDHNGYLEHLVSLLSNVEGEIYCLFGNMDGTYTSPFLPQVVGGIVFNPKIYILPSHTTADLPPCLHDSLRLQELVRDQDDGCVPLVVNH